MCGATMILLTFLLAALESDEDRALFTEIYDQNHDRMEQTALRILKDPHDAEDAVQNAFLQIIRNFDALLEIPCKKRIFWCISIVKNEALAILRKKKKTVLMEELEGNPAAGVEEAMSYKEVVRLFAQLPETYRSVLEMKMILGYSGKEIAKRMGLTENAVNVRITRGRAMLREIAGREGIHP